MTATVISNSDHITMVMTKTLAEKLVMTTSSLLYNTMAGAAVVTLTAHHLTSTLKQMTTSVETDKENH